MTFAKPSCDCDECDLPPDIAAAVKKRKATHNYGANKRINIRQSRILVARHGGYSVWKLVLPADCGDDPIVELRNSWRILFVERLAETLQIQSIGCGGIIGSALEESQRKVLDWKEGNAYFLPINKGVACGWICKQTNDKSDTEQKYLSTDENDQQQTTIYVMKATPQALDDDTDNKAPSWALKAKDSFTSLIQTEVAAKEDDESKSSVGLKEIGLTAKDSNEIRSILMDAIEITAHAGE